MIESCKEFEKCKAHTAKCSVLLDVEYTDELGKNGFASRTRMPSVRP
ncbi:hypothetical protein [Microbacterium testaceum]|nr:hypothetical protein [Microbacterium testaceum]